MYNNGEGFDSLPLPQQFLLGFISYLRLEYSLAACYLLQHFPPPLFSLPIKNSLLKENEHTQKEGLCGEAISDVYSHEIDILMLESYNYNMSKEAVAIESNVSGTKWVSQLV